MQIVDSQTLCISGVADCHFRVPYPPAGFSVEYLFQVKMDLVVPAFPNGNIQHGVYRIKFIYEKREAKPTVVKESEESLFSEYVVCVDAVVVFLR